MIYTVPGKSRQIKRTLDVKPNADSVNFWCNFRKLHDINIIVFLKMVQKFFTEVRVTGYAPPISYFLHICKQRFTKSKKRPGGIPPRAPGNSPFYACMRIDEKGLFLNVRKQSIFLANKPKNEVPFFVRVRRFTEDRQKRKKTFFPPLCKVVSGNHHYR